MPRLRALSAAALAAALLSACTTPVEPVGNEPLDASYAVLSFNWTDGSAFRVAVRVREENGSAVVCGALLDATPGGANQQIALAMQSSFNLRHDNRLLLNTLRPLAGPYRAADFTGLQARCVDTGRAWSDDMADRRGFGLTGPRSVGA